MTEREAFIKILEFISNTFYRTKEQDYIYVQLSTDGSNTYDYFLNTIKVSADLAERYHQLKLPRFVIYYHELGHFLYSKNMFKLLDNWSRIDKGPLEWHNKYKHLVNWIEDFFIEEKLLKEHSYLTDVLNCIKKLPLNYDINAIDKAFHYYYVYNKPSPALNNNDQIIFINYINDLLKMRAYNKVRFGHGVLSSFTITKTNDTLFVLKLIEFYNWCVLKGILNDNEELPALTHPMNGFILNPGFNINTGNNSNIPVNNDCNIPVTSDSNSNKTGSYSNHSNTVKSNNDKYLEIVPLDKTTEIFKEELVQENLLLQKELLDTSQVLQTQQHTIDGLFTSNYEPTAIIQNKVIVNNFFNPNRIIDQVLFLQKTHTYMNVAIFRDISGSVAASEHKLMHQIIEKLYKDIPVNITYYLYSSGKYSILEVPYIPWEKLEKPPKEYLSNPLYQQLEGGTNSDAIADVITQQLSDKWLNIIITDGDLTRLLQRDNIYALLKNVFVVCINSKVHDELLQITVRETEDIENISKVLSTINLEKIIV
jgi:hypothetical protein